MTTKLQVAPSFHRQVIFVFICVPASLPRACSRPGEQLAACWCPPNHPLLFRHVLPYSICGRHCVAETRVFLNVLFEEVVDKVHIRTSRSLQASVLCLPLRHLQIEGILPEPDMSILDVFLKIAFLENASSSGVF